ncbi:hypothetical protein [Rhodococcus sp. SJ-2]
MFPRECRQPFASTPSSTRRSSPNPRPPTPIASRIPGARTLLLPEAGHDLREQAWVPLAEATRELADTPTRL